MTGPTDRGYPSSGPFAPLRAGIDGGYRRAGTVSFPGTDVTLYSRA